MPLHLRVLGGRSVDHAVDGSVRRVKLEVGKNAAEGSLGIRNEVLVPEEMRAILSFGPRSAQVEDGAGSQVLGKVRVSFDVRGSKRAAPKLLVKRKH